MKFKYSLVDNAEGYEFVNGNTRHLAKMNQKDLAVLHGNGDPRVKAEPLEETESVVPTAPAGRVVKEGVKPTPTEVK